MIDQLPENDPANLGNGPLANGEDTGPAIGMLSQYIKDLSFENPNAPAVYQWREEPQIDVQFNIGASVVGEGVHESVLKIDVTARNNEGVCFAVDLSYAGLFAIRNVPNDQVQAFMLAEAPRILFPFARRVVADAVRDGGFPPMLLEPIDFHGLYVAQQQSAAAQQPGFESNPVGNA